MIEQVQDTSPQSVLSPLPETFVVPKRKKFSKIVILLIIVLLIAGGIYAGIQIGKKQISPNEIISETVSNQMEATSIPEPTEIIEPTIVPTTDEMVNWKVYRNEEYGFEFKYPLDWKIWSDRVV